MHLEQNRIQAIQIAKAKITGRPLYLDTETTGLGPTDQVVEIAILDPEGDPLVESLVRPTINIPPDAVAIHGITDEMVREAPSWPALWPTISPILKGREVAPSLICA